MPLLHKVSLMIVLTMLCILLALMELSKTGYIESRRKATTASAKEAQVHEAVIQDEMLPWLTEYPETRFTSHVMEVITSMVHDTALMSKQCTTYHELSVGSTCSIS